MEGGFRGGGSCVPVPAGELCLGCPCAGGAALGGCGAVSAARGGVRGCGVRERCMVRVCV